MQVFKCAENKVLFNGCH